MRERDSSMKKDSTLKRAERERRSHWFMEISRCRREQSPMEMRKSVDAGESRAQWKCGNQSMKERAVDEVV